MRFNPAKRARPWIRVDDEVAGLQLEERLDRPDPVRGRRLRGGAPAEDPDELRVRDDDEADRGQPEAFRDRADADLDALDLATGLREDLAEAVLLGRVPAEDDDARAPERGLPQGVRRLPDPDRERLDRPRAEVDLRRQALEIEARPTRGLLLEPRHRARVSRRADPQAFRAVLDAQRLHVDDDGGAGEEGRRQHARSFLDRARVGRHRHVDARERLDAALVDRVEGAQGLDLVPEHLDAQRPVRGEREHVQDLAAQADLAGLLRERGPRVAGAHEPLEQPFDVELLVHAQGEELALEVLRRRDRLEEREDRGDDDPRPPLGGTGQALRDPQSQPQALGIDVRAARGRRVLPRGEPLRARAERLEVVDELARLRVGRRDDEPGRRGAARERREHHGLRRSPQAPPGGAPPGREELLESFQPGERRQLARVQDRLPRRRRRVVRIRHTSPRSESTRSASCAAQLSASFRVRPQAPGNCSPSASAAIRNALAWASPRSSRTT
jgi:hypothetical protein